MHGCTSVAGVCSFSLSGVAVVCLCLCVCVCVSVSVCVCVCVSVGCLLGVAAVCQLGFWVWQLCVS